MKKIGLLLLLGTTVYAQSTKDVMLRAMKDEQARSMKELKLEGHEAPFYISYDINDLDRFFATATQGALVNSTGNKVRAKNMRLLVGNYEFNDESIDNDIFTAPQPNEIAMPLENDYDGIRRALWVTTDAIYRSAAQHFKENQNKLKEKGKPLAEIPHRTFARVPVQQVDKYTEFSPIKQPYFEKYVRDVSGFFNATPGLFTASATLAIAQGNRFYLNTEGISSITPVSAISLNVQVSKDHKWQNARNLSLFYTSLDKLPTLAQLQPQLLKLAEEALSSDAVKLEEEYTGPVLFLDEAVASLFNATLFGRESLVASNNLEVDNRFRFDAQSTLDGKIGKPVAGDALSVIARPHLTSFNGTELLGAFEMDSEGVVPPDEIRLIDKGVLKDLLNDRSLTKSTQSANGHADGPGVIEITFDNGPSVEGLKKMLVDKAKEEGLAFAFIVKEFNDRGLLTSQLVKIDVSTGKEQLMKQSIVKNLELKDLRKAKASTKQKAWNFPYGDGAYTSFISPEALLLFDVELNALPSFGQETEEEDEALYVEPPKGHKR